VIRLALVYLKPIQLQACSAQRRMGDRREK